MTAAQRRSRAYRDGVLLAYRGELVGEHLYRGLAEHSADAERRTKLLAVARVERLTHRRLRPIAERLGIHMSEADWGPIVERRTRELRCLSWHDIMAKAVVDWPPFIGRFEALLPLAPPGDLRTIQLLVEHEVVLVEFVRLESIAVPSDDSLRGLRAFLAVDATVAGEVGF
jgi:hypothetical protein